MRQKREGGAGEKPVPSPLSSSPSSGGLVGLKRKQMSRVGSFCPVLVGNSGKRSPGGTLSHSPCLSQPEGAWVCALEPPSVLE